MFEVANQIETLLGVLAKAYTMENDLEMAKIIVNGRPRIEEHTTEYTDFGETEYGHSLFFKLPEVLFLQIFKERHDLANKIRSDLNNLITAKHESISDVSLEMDLPTDTDWRRESGLLLTGERLVTHVQEDRIWEPGMFRLFISHRSSVKDSANKLKQQLKFLGISAFVAHENVIPTKDWQIEMENALASMDGFIAIMTPDFHNSQWTDQEVGFAFARGVPLITVKLGIDPYGFMGKFQGLRGNWDTLAKDLLKLLIHEPKMLEAFITSIEQCSSFDQGNFLASGLSSIKELNAHQISRIVNSFNTNISVRDSYGFDGRWPSKFGGGLVEHLKRLTGETYIKTSSGEIAKSVTKNK